MTLSNTDRFSTFCHPYRHQYINNKRAMLSQGNRVMPQLLFSV